MATAVDAIVTVDEKGIIRSFNRAAERLFDYRADEVLGQPISLLMPAPHRERHHEYIERYLATGEARIIGIGREVQARRKDGTLIPVYLAVSEFEVSEGRRFAGVLHDISAEAEARELRERLARAAGLSAMTEMTAALAHEINQPLAAIAAYAQAARGQMHQGDEAKLAQTLDKVVEQSVRASAVVERVQRLVKGLSGDDASADFQLADLNALLEEVVSLVHMDARKRGVEVVLEGVPHLPNVYCDAVQIQQVGINLIRNAVDAIADVGCQHGHIVRVYTCHSSPDNRTVQILVEDSGAGVPAGEQEALFAPFQSGKPGGMGMGLAVCRTIIAKHGGTLDCRNNTPRPGATFSFALPVAK